MRASSLDLRTPLDLHVPDPPDLSIAADLSLPPGIRNLWAVGEAGLIVHGDGTAFATVPSGTSATLSGIWASAPDDAWSVGQSGTILHWNGLVWSAVPSGTTLDLSNVCGSGPNDVWAIAEYDILHWNGTAWSKHDGTGKPARPRRLWCGDAKNIWVIASGPGISWMRWDGTSWQTMVTFPWGPNYVHFVGTIGGAPPDTVFVSYEYWFTGGTGFMGYSGLRHWNGSLWKGVAGDNPWGSIAGSGPTNVWMINYHGSPSGGVFRFDGIRLNHYDITEYPSALWVGSPVDVWGTKFSKLVRWNGVDDFALVWDTGGKNLLALFGLK